MDGCPLAGLFGDSWGRNAGTEVGKDFDERGKAGSAFCVTASVSVFLALGGARALRHGGNLGIHVWKMMRHELGFDDICTIWWRERV